VPYQTIHEKMRAEGYNRIMFYIDLPSICRGFYNGDVVQLEIGNYVQSRQMPSLFFDEARIFYDGLMNQFRAYNPKFITFFDSGQCIQNKTLHNAYKGDRSRVVDNLMLEDAEKDLFRKIKNYYMMDFIPRFTIPGLSKVAYLDEYESDFIPWIVRYNEWLGSENPQTLNVILSTDKDLLQTCRFSNVIQCCTLYSKKEGKLLFYTLDDINAISYIYKKFKRGILTAEHIPLILAISGDKADNINGVPGVGDANAIKLIMSANMSPNFYNNSPLPPKLEPYRKLILRNFQLIDFEEQYRRIPITYKNSLRETFKSM
jgi:hypothetical protein